MRTNLVRPLVAVATIMTTRNIGLDAVTDVLDACGYSGRVVGAAEAHALTAPARINFARVRLCLPTTAVEGGILRAAGLLSEAAAMHLHIYRDESRAGHIEIVGEGDHPWTIDLVFVVTAAILVVGFAGAVVAHLVR